MFGTSITRVFEARLTEFFTLRWSSFGVHQSFGLGMGFATFPAECHRTINQIRQIVLDVRVGLR